jgi:hypothetical protein
MVIELACGADSVRIVTRSPQSSDIYVTRAGREEHLGYGHTPFLRDNVSAFLAGPDEADGKWLVTLAEPYGFLLGQARGGDKIIVITDGDKNPQGQLTFNRQDAESAAAKLGSLG